MENVKRKVGVSGLLESVEIVKGRGANRSPESRALCSFSLTLTLESRRADTGDIAQSCSVLRS